MVAVPEMLPEMTEDLWSAVFAAIRRGRMTMLERERASRAHCVRADPDGGIRPTLAKRLGDRHALHDRLARVSYTDSGRER